MSHSIDFSIEMCRRDELARLEAGKITGIVNHATPINYGVETINSSPRGVLLITNYALESCETQSANRYLKKISRQFCHGRSIFVDLYLTKKVAVRRLAVKSQLTFGKITRVIGGIKTRHNSANENLYSEFHLNASNEFWVPAWSFTVDHYSTRRSSLARGLVSVSSVIDSSSNITFCQGASSINCDILRFEVTCFPDVESAFNLCRARLILRPNPYIPVFPSMFLKTARKHKRLPKVSALNSSQSDTSIGSQPVTDDPFVNCPDDILVEILSKLPSDDYFLALIALSRTCRRFYYALRKSSLYTTLDLDLINLSLHQRSALPVLPFLATRARDLRHLRISWLPSLPGLQMVKQFLSGLSPVLLSFVAESSPIIQDELAEIILKKQPNLETLSLTGCHALSTDFFGKIANLKNLRFLQLDDVGLVPWALDKIVDSCHKLEQISARRLPTHVKRILLKRPSNAAEYKGNAVGMVINGIMKDDYWFDNAFLKLATNVGATCLHTVSLDSSCFRDSASLEHFVTACHNIERLYIESFPTPVKLQAVHICKIISENCLRLRDLMLGASYRKFRIKAQDFRLLARLPNLERVRIEKVSVTVMELVAFLHSLPSLMVLSLSGNAIAKQHLQDLREAFPNRKIDYVLTSCSLEEESSSDTNDWSDDSGDGNGNADHGVLPFGAVEPVDADRRLANEGNVNDMDVEENPDRAVFREVGLGAQAANRDVWIYHINEYCKRNKWSPETIRLNWAPGASIFDSDDAEE